MALVLVLSDVSAQTWAEAITPEPKTVGRDDSADVRLEHASVSRTHCRFWTEQGTYYVEDCGSRNGTWVNGLPVVQSKLDRGDRILVGKFELVVADPAQLQPTGVLVDPEHNTPAADPAAGRSAQPPAPRSPRPPIDEERHLTRAVHQRLTPSRRLGLPGLRVETAYRPSGLLGGDCFKCFELGTRWVLAIFDPMNHGTKAALTVMLLRSELERWMELSAEPGRCLAWINQELVSLAISDLYLCGTLAVWNPATQSLVYSTAGQNPPLLLRQGEVLNLGQTADGLPLGVESNEQFAEQFWQLRPRDRMFFFTDGVGIALRERQGSGSQARLVADEITRHARQPLQTQVERVLASESSEYLDDALLVGCEVT